ncbi:hypothetical protein TNCV_4827861 [Trichonephila clavipes]|uniref:Uncharacterized protein n=1 Tax=Trichonephila clavipes TaxID=2585209 RepID=A0A8X6SIR7_TRICX|nr:hypothetical protein TNCV_4827861 [Trichonephila clavipes]
MMTPACNKRGALLSIRDGNPLQLKVRLFFPKKPCLARDLNPNPLSYKPRVISTIRARRHGSLVVKQSQHNTEKETSQKNKARKTLNHAFRRQFRKTNETKAFHSAATYFVHRQRALSATSISGLVGQPQFFLSASSSAVISSPNWPRGCSGRICIVAVFHLFNTQELSTFPPVNDLVVSQSENKLPSLYFKNLDKYQSPMMLLSIGFHPMLTSLETKSDKEDCNASPPISSTLTYSEHQSRVESEILKEWRTPPNHHWYESKHPGSSFLLK